MSTSETFTTALTVPVGCALLFSAQMMVWFLPLR
jgi:hypothetical protein